MTDKTLRKHFKKCLELKTQLDALKKEYETEKAWIIAAMNGDEKMTIAGITANNIVVNGSKFDRTRFDVDYPGIYSSYMIPNPGTRFTIK